MNDERQDQHDNGEEQEFYTEPPRMRLKDSLGVVLALIALLVIGYAGYLWLTPDNSGSAVSTDAVAAAGAADKASGASAPPARPPASAGNQPPSSGPADTEPAAGEPAAAGHNHSNAQAAGTPADANAQPPHLHEHDLSCAYCGMFSDKSLSHSVAYWADGSHTHHDSWDCLFNYDKDNDLALSRAEVAEHGGSLGSPQWLDAAAAHFLYGTQRVQGSMPPFVAAFASLAAAEAAQPELGGEVLDFGGLKARWE